MTLTSKGVAQYLRRRREIVSEAFDFQRRVKSQSQLRRIVLSILRILANLFFLVTVFYYYLYFSSVSDRYYRTIDWYPKIESYHMTYVTDVTEKDVMVEVSGPSKKRGFISFPECTSRQMALFRVRFNDAGDRIFWFRETGRKIAACNPLYSRRNRIYAMTNALEFSDTVFLDTHTSLRVIKKEGSMKLARTKWTSFRLEFSTGERVTLVYPSCAFLGINPLVELRYNLPGENSLTATSKLVSFAVGNGLPLIECEPWRALRYSPLAIDLNRLMMSETNVNGNVVDEVTSGLVDFGDQFQFLTLGPASGEQLNQVPFMEAGTCRIFCLHGCVCGGFEFWRTKSGVHFGVPYPQTLEVVHTGSCFYNETGFHVASFKAAEKSDGTVGILLPMPIMLLPVLTPEIGSVWSLVTPQYLQREHIVPFSTRFGPKCNSTMIQL